MSENINELKVVSFDMDGVLADFGTGLILKMRERQHLTSLLTPDIYQKFRDFDIEKNFPDRYHDEITEIINAPGFFRTLPPIPGSFEILERVLHSGYQPVICTKPSRANPFCHTEKADWIREHLHPIVGVSGLTDIIFTRDKTVYPFYTHIDDKMYYDKFIAGTLKWIPITFAQPWNLDDPNPLRMTKDNYEDIFSQINIPLKPIQKYC
jgi:5'-nucleotidase